ncbi:MAG: TIGR01777 family oxidoreductase [Pirellulales bacterium]
MRVAVTGAGGLVGSTLVPRLTAGGHQVVPAARRSGGAGGLQWDPERGLVDSSRWEGFDAVIHLAGENIGEGRWTASQKEKIRTSRVVGTRKLAEGLAALQTPPRTLICASAIGFYGSRGAELLTEQSPAGTGFLAGVCQEWESSADPLRAAGVRVVHARFGIILSPRGGALQKMLLPFQLGAGGIVGSGQQYWSWVAIDDVASALEFLLGADQLRGPVNVVAPEAVTNAQFTHALGRVLHRPTLIPMPAFAARLALGEMADELLLASARVVPQQLTAAGFTFHHPQLEPALHSLLNR